MMCAVGNAAVSGGVRRTAMISLFDQDDDEMRLSKNGDFERDNNQRWNANNSAVWPVGGLTQVEYMHQFLEMVESGRGEPGIFNRESALNMRPERRQRTRVWPSWWRRRRRGLGLPWRRYSSMSGIRTTDHPTQRT